MGDKVSKARWWAALPWPVILLRVKLVKIDPRPSECSGRSMQPLSHAVSHASLPPVQFEFMIESILYARDAWLKEGGVIWPTTAALHLVPCSADKDYRSKVLFWDNAYEFNLSALK